MVKILINIIVVLGLLIAVPFFSENMHPEIYGIAIGTTLLLIGNLTNVIITEKKFLKVYLQSVLKPKKEIRLSFAYLFKIEYRAKYLLVKSNRIPNTYQPIGGVYKYFSPEADSKLAKMTIVPDTAIVNDNNSEYDLRVKMKRRIHIRHFLKWFSNSEQRECGPWREFYEELVATDILPAVEFNHIYYQMVGQDIEPIHYDRHFKIDTLKYVDVYVPRYSSVNQRNAIAELTKDTVSDKFIWVTDQEIENKVTEDGRRIADHTYKIFQTNKIK